MGLFSNCFKRSILGKELIMFRNCKNQEDLKSLFKKLAFRLHPDHGGSNELMILCKDCFDESLEKLAKTAEPKKEIKIERSNYEPYEKT